MHCGNELRYLLLICSDNFSINKGNIPTRWAILDKTQNLYIMCESQLEEEVKINRQDQEPPIRTQYTAL